MQLLKAVAEANIEEKFDAEAVFQLAMFWLKAAADKNIEHMFVTRAVFHEPTLPLKFVPVNTPRALAHMCAHTKTRTTSCARAGAHAERPRARR
jgi:hypothetical protein